MVARKGCWSMELFSTKMRYWRARALFHWTKRLVDLLNNLFQLHFVKWPWPDVVNQLQRFIPKLNTLKRHNNNDFSHLIQQKHSSLSLKNQKFKELYKYDHNVKGNLFCLNIVSVKWTEWRSKWSILWDQRYFLCKLLPR